MFLLIVIFSCFYRVQYHKEMHFSSVPKILQSTIFEISNILREIEQRPNFARTSKFQGTI